MSDVNAIARRLDDAQRNARAVAQLAEPMSMDDAYRVQRASMQLRYARGETQVGIKMGFTSRAKIVQMGVSDMIWGRLTSDMVVEDGGATPFARYVHPRVEPEIAFVLKKELVGHVTPAQAMAAVEAVAPALEIIDSRYENFKFSPTDVVADNSSSSGFVLGAWNSPQIDISNLGLVMTINGRPVQIGSSAAILGHPARSLAAAARFAADAGEPLQPGWVVLAGGATAAEALQGGQWVELEVEQLGRAGFSIV